MDENSLEKLNNEFHVKVKTPMCFLFSHCPLLTGKFCQNVHPMLKKSVRYKGVRHIEVFL